MDKNAANIRELFLISSANRILNTPFLSVLRRRIKQLVGLYKHIREKLRYDFGKCVHFGHT